LILQAKKPDNRHQRPAGRTGFVLLLATAAAVAIVIAGALLAPYTYAEYEFDLHGEKPRALPMPVEPVAGTWFDDYFVVETVDPTTFAIGEPRYYQGNYSYLILGAQRAILFDAGTGLRDIEPVVRSLTHLPVTVIASHLHFDHVGALGRFDKTALIDEPSLRARPRDSQLTLRRYEFLGFADRLAVPTFRVDEWWPPGSTIDLGGRRLRVLATPGHTPTSVSLYDETRRQLFAGDFIYPGELYAFLPGASRSEYHATATRLLAILDPATQIFAAHMEDSPAPLRAPVLEVEDLRALERTLESIEHGDSTSSGFYPRIFPVRGAIKFATGWPWNNR
jgi:glyoxylase-like metal-dependent hydrolase (beta-lactamase superfamily II)